MSEDFKEIIEQLKAEVEKSKQLRAECTQLRQSAEALLDKAKQWQEENFQ